MHKLPVDFDLIINAGRVFCAETGLNGPGAVATVGDRIVAFKDGRVAFDRPPAEAFTHPPANLGLDLPETVHLASILRDRGWPIPAHILTSESLIKTLIEYLKSVS